MSQSNATHDILPVTILTGFLGSGKTTLLSRLLRHAQFARTAVIINEFGEVGLDHELLEQSREELVLLANGCVCCTVRGDLIATLEHIASQRAEFGIDRVVLETTGLADPAPILHTLMGDPQVMARFRLEHVVTTVDAVNGMRTLDQHQVALNQAAVADRLLITKQDLVTEEDLQVLKGRLQTLNHGAPLHAVQNGEIDPALLFASGEQVRDQRSLDDWLGEEEANDRKYVYRHVHHDDGIRSFSIIRDEPISWAGLSAWLEMLAAMRGDDLLRMKGIVHVREHPDRPVVIHGVQHVFHPPHTLDAWPGEDRRSRLVFITRNIEQEDIDMTLQVFENRTNKN